MRENALISTTKGVSESVMVPQCVSALNLNDYLCSGLVALFVLNFLVHLNMNIEYLSISKARNRSESNYSSAASCRGARDLTELVKGRC